MVSSKVIASSPWVACKARTGALGRLEPGSRVKISTTYRATGVIRSSLNCEVLMMFQGIQFNWPLKMELKEQLTFAMKTLVRSLSTPSWPGLVPGYSSWSRINYVDLANRCRLCTRISLRESQVSQGYRHFAQRVLTPKWCQMRIVVDLSIRTAWMTIIRPNHSTCMANFFIW